MSLRFCNKRHLNHYVNLFFVTNGILIILFIRFCHKCHLNHYVNMFLSQTSFKSFCQYVTVTNVIWIILSIHFCHKRHLTHSVNMFLSQTSFDSFCQYVSVTNDIWLILSICSVTNVIWLILSIRFCHKRHLTYSVNTFLSQTSFDWFCQYVSVTNVIWLILSIRFCHKRHLTYSVNTFLSQWDARQSGGVRAVPASGALRLGDLWPSLPATQWSPGLPHDPGLHLSTHKVIQYWP